MKKPETFPLGIERGADGFAAAWCLTMPGCCVVVAPGQEVVERASLAILEFAAWVHNRTGERIGSPHEAIVIAEEARSSANLPAGESVAFFAFDAEPAQPREFPAWANAHDRAYDELVQLVASLPVGMFEPALPGGARALAAIIERAAAGEELIRTVLTGQPSRLPEHALVGLLRALKDAHLKLQEAICDVPAGHRARSEGAAGAEVWSVRKAMRRSIWQLRHHTWELRRAIGTIWLA